MLLRSIGVACLAPKHRHGGLVVNEVKESGNVVLEMKSGRQWRWAGCGLSYFWLAECKSQQAWLLTIRDYFAINRLSRQSPKIRKIRMDKLIDKYRGPADAMLCESANPCIDMACQPIPAGPLGQAGASTDVLAAAWTVKGEIVDTKTLKTNSTLLHR